MPVNAPPRTVTLRPKAPPAAALRFGMIAKQLLPHGDRPVTLFEDKVRVLDTAASDETLPRRYTLTYDDRTAELFLAIGAEYSQQALGRPQTRARRDELLAELTGGPEPRLTVICLAGSDELAGQAVDPALRRRIFEREMPFALAVLRYGDRFFFERHPEIDRAPVCVEFRSADPRYAGKREYGRITDYRVTHIAGESRRLAVAAATLAALGLGALLMGMWRKRGDRD